MPREVQSSRPGSYSMEMEEENEPPHEKTNNVVSEQV